MKTKSLTVIFAYIAGATATLAASFDIPVDADTSWSYVDGKVYKDYDTVNINVFDSVTLTNTNQRLVDAPFAGTTYNFVAYGESATGQLVVSSSLYNGFVLGQTGTNCSFVFDIGLTITPQAGVNKFITVQSGVTATFLKDVNASVMTSEISSTGATINFGNGTSSGTFTSAGGASLNSSVMNFKSNYTANLGASKTLTVKDTSTVNVSGGTLAVGLVNTIGTSTFDQTSGTTTARLSLAEASRFTMGGGTLNVESIVTAGTSTFTQTAGTTNLNTSGTYYSTIGNGTKVEIKGGNLTWGGTNTTYVTINGELELSGGTSRFSAKVASGGVLKLSGGTYLNGGTFQVDGGTIEYHSGSFVTGIGMASSSSIKLYGDLNIGNYNPINFYTASVLNIYLNGFNFSLSDFRYNTGGAVSLNLIVEDGYDWKNDTFHIRNTSSGHEMTENAIYDAIASITVEGVSIDKSQLNIVSDGGAGYYVNLAAIPEAAEWAAILGALALGLAIFRRRNKR